jgi:hypothetical protein
MKRAVYYCPGCKKRVERRLERAPTFLLSVCATTGRIERMRKSRDQSKVKP